MDDSLAALMSLEEAQDILRPRMQSFTDALAHCQKIWNAGRDGAVPQQGYEQGYAFAHMSLDASARATILNQEWYTYANKTLSGDRGVVFAKDQLQRFIIIDERLIVRFKLLDRDLCSRNYPTDRAQGWELQLPLDGIPPVARLTYGYRLDLTGVEVKDAFVTHPRGDINEWVWQTSGERIDTFAIPLRLRAVGQPEVKVFAYDNYRLAA